MRIDIQLFNTILLLVLLIPIVHRIANLFRMNLNDVLRVNE